MTALGSWPPHETFPPVPAETAQALENELRRTIAGDVRFDRLYRTLYSTDASIYEILPAGVVLPKSIADAQAVVNACRKHKVPIIARGGGTGLAGGAVGSGVQLDFSRYMNAILDLDAAARTVRVQPGVVLDELNAFLASHKLHFAPDVATSSRATIGGMIANNSCGAHSVIYGRTVDHVAELTVVLADGGVAVGGETGGNAGTWERGNGLELHSSSRSHVPTFPRSHPSSLSQKIAAELQTIRTEYAAEVQARFPQTLRRNGGYMLDLLCAQPPNQPPNPVPILCGSEGTLGLVVEAVLKLVPLPTCKGLLVVHFETLLDSLSATPHILQHNPAAIELMDWMLLEAAFQSQTLGKYRPLIHGQPAGVLVVEFFGDTPQAVERRIEKLQADLQENKIGYAYTKCLSREAQDGIWTIRKSGLGLMMSKPGDAQPYSFIEDAAVPPARLREYVEKLEEILRGFAIHDVGYYAHASVGVLHIKPVLNLRKQTDIDRMYAIADAVSSLVLEFGGAMTGEHGDGLVRSCWTEKMYGPKLCEAFRRVKQAFDPENLFNPGKIIAAPPMHENLRFGPQLNVLQTSETLDFSTHGGLAGLVNMCSGVGQCRQRLVGTMCPSYMATGDELHTTRGRANALRIALSNRGLLRGLDDPALDEVMDLCLSCKACKTECPTGVDMAKMKAEWLFHRNQRRGAPALSRLIAGLPQWAKWGQRFAPLSNWLTRQEWLRHWLERKYGLDARISPPPFARRTFQAWFDQHTREGIPAGVGARKDSRTSKFASKLPRPGSRGCVLYFVDTWTNYFKPEAGIAAVRLLEAAGYEVRAPKLQCCGRPAISKGLLTEAAGAADENLDTLFSYLNGERAGSIPVAILFTEPSCFSAFVDEYPQLMRQDARKAEITKTIAQRCHLVESFLANLLRETPDALAFQQPAAPLLYHAHCHQKALLGTADANELLRIAFGDACREINSGCCGMAGSFGHEAAHYEVARAVGEQRLFPAVRNRAAAQIAVSGFSCRCQIEHHTGAPARHVVEYLAELLA